MPEPEERVAVIGLGAMARSLAASLQQQAGAIRIGAALLHPGSSAAADAPDGMAVFTTVNQLIGWKPSVVVECAGHEAVRVAVPALLRAGIDVVVVSAGSLADPERLRDLEQAAKDGGSRMTVASGAIGALDVLRSARIAGLDTVAYTGIKPPAAWKGTPAETIFDLGAITTPTTIFHGNAADASTRYPKNANVTATVALAGIGFERTEVTLVADPGAVCNSHSLSATGAFGRFSLMLENQPLPANPKTSWLAALSIEHALIRHFQTLKL